MDSNQKPQYHSLADIQERKDELLSGIRKDDERMRSIWSSLFSSPKASAVSTPSKRLNTLMNTGAGLLDAVILGWKLYHKFGRNKSSRGRRR